MPKHVDVDGTLNVDGDLEVTGSVSQTGDSTVTGAVTGTTVTATGTVQGADLVATDDLTVGDDAAIGGDLVVTGKASATNVCKRIGADDYVFAPLVGPSYVLSSGVLVIDLGTLGVPVATGAVYILGVTAHAGVLPIRASVVGDTVTFSDGSGSSSTAFSALALYKIN